MIFVNMVIMSFEHHDQRQMYRYIQQASNSFFTTMYALGKGLRVTSAVGNISLHGITLHLIFLEAIVKIVGLRHYYFTVLWNVFDFGLVVFAFLDLFLIDVEWNLPFPPTMLRVVRVFRIGRVLRLIKVMQKC